MTKYIGIDGCKAGWFITAYDGMRWHAHVIDKIVSFQIQKNTSNRILIDMPIGLSCDQYKRTIDIKLRRLLSPRGATVFSAPARSALDVSDYRDALNINMQILGKGISKQSFFLGKKIKSLEAYILSDASDHYFFWESHPELCFMMLHPKQNVILKSKKTKEGRQERLDILSQYAPQAVADFKYFSNHFPRKTALEDDILDSMVLSLTNALMGNNPPHKVDIDTTDAKGLIVNVACFDPKGKL